MTREETYENYVAPFVGRIQFLEHALRSSPCMLIVRHSGEVQELVGYGGRIMALEVKRLRDALQKIADGTVADADVSAFAWNTLD